MATFEDQLALASGQHYGGETWQEAFARHGMEAALESGNITEAARILSTVTISPGEEQSFEEAEKVAQIFSAIFFTGLGLWLMFANGTKLSFIQRASLEKRLTVCCMINTYIAVFSAFFNFFQLTEVDNIALPRATSFTLDFARPFEWVVTCPMMQLVLVLMGGSKIPEYRRVLMPGLSATVLFLGTSSMLLEGVVRFIPYILGIFVAGYMWFLNNKQIIEHSDDAEGLISGDSEFRKASVLLIATWFPFPIWFLISPEGLGLVKSVLVVQCGWAFLNIISKFSFIFYIQRIKDNYCNRLKVKREMQGQRSGVSHVKTSQRDNVDDAGSGRQVSGGDGPSDVQRSFGELNSVVIETMTFLGMAQHSDRFVKLLMKADITGVSMVERLTKERCEELSLPWDLIGALQKRIHVWQLEMRDTAEMELERGEQHYRNEPADPEKGMITPEARSMQHGNSGVANIAMALESAPVSPALEQIMNQMQDFIESRMHVLEDAMRDVLVKTDTICDTVRHSEEHFNQKTDGIREMQIKQQTLTREVQAASDENMTMRIDQMLGQAVQAIQSDVGLRARDGGNGNSSALTQQLEDVVKGNEETSNKVVDSIQRNLQVRFEGFNATWLKQQDEFGASISKKMEDVLAKAIDGSEKNTEATSRSIAASMETYITNAARQSAESANQLLKNMEETSQRSQQGMQVLAGRNDAMLEAIRKTELSGREGILQSAESANQLLKNMEETSQRSQRSMEALSRSMQTDTSGGGAEQVDQLGRRLEDIVARSSETAVRAVEAAGMNIQQGMQVLAGRNDAMLEAIRKTELSGREGILELRQGIMCLQQQGFEDVNGGMSRSPSQGPNMTVGGMNGGMDANFGGHASVGIGSQPMDSMASGMQSGMQIAGRPQTAVNARNQSPRLMPAQPMSDPNMRNAPPMQMQGSQFGAPAANRPQQPQQVFDQPDNNGGGNFGGPHSQPITRSNSTFDMNLINN